MSKPQPTTLNVTHSEKKEAETYLPKNPKPSQNKGELDQRPQPRAKSDF